MEETSKTENLLGVHDVLLSLTNFDEYQQRILKYIWQRFVDEYRWPQSYQVHNEFDPEGNSVRKTLIALSGGVVREFPNGESTSRYILTPLGAVIASDGKLFVHAIKLIKILKKKMASGLFKGEISSSELREALGCSSIEALSLTRFASIFLPHQLGYSPIPDGGCTLKFNEDIDRLRSILDEVKYIYELIVTHSDLNSPFLKEERDIYESIVIYSPQKLNLGFDRLIRKKAKFRANILSVTLSLLLASIVILAWIPSIVQIDTWYNLSESVRLVVTIICALFGFGLFTTPLNLRKKVTLSSYSRQVKKAIQLADAGTFEEIMNVNHNQEILWEEVKRNSKKNKKNVLIHENETKS